MVGEFLAPFAVCTRLGHAAFFDERLDCILGQLHNAPIFAEQRDPGAPDIDNLPDAVIPRQGRTGAETLQWRQRRVFGYLTARETSITDRGLAVLENADGRR